MKNSNLIPNNSILSILILLILWINVILYLTINIILIHIHYLNIVYCYKNINILDNIVNINYNNVILILILQINISSIVKMVI